MPSLNNFEKSKWFFARNVIESDEIIMDWSKTVLLGNR